MAKKTFNDCNKGDTLYLLNASNLEIKKVTLVGTSRWYGYASFTMEFKEIDISGCIGGRSRNNGLFTTEEEALSFKNELEKGKKVFCKLKKGDTVYVIVKGENEVKKVTVDLVDKSTFIVNVGEIKFNTHFVGIEFEDKTTNYTWYNHEMMYISIYLNEKDALKAIRESARRQKKRATDQYLKSIENYDGKPIALKDNAGSDLHYGDTVVYIRRVGFHGHPELRKGVIVGESKTTITVLDESEKKDGMPTGWRGETNKDSNGKHSVQPQSVMLFKAAEVNTKSGFVFVKS
jgi:uncharacterized Zn ribbon protein